MQSLVKETLFIVLIHGFQGGEDTFGDLPKTLKENLSSLDIVIKHFVFKSQGNLATCVSTFRRWHQEQVQAIEQMKQTEFSTVKTVLVCHSMGGIIAAESLLAMTDDDDPLHANILGILAYDTPYLGLNPPVIHRTISTRVNTVTSAVNTAKEWIPAGLFASKSTQVAINKAPQKSGWGLAKTVAAVGAGVAAVGALSYYAKDPVVNHLHFVSVLYKPEDLSKRMKRLNALQGVGFAAFYTVITAPSEDEKERTFCLLPEEKDGRWIRQENGLAKDEVDAHCGMFTRGSNDHFDEMCIQSLQIIRNWIGAGH